jgi:hypothetical protein
MSQLIEQALEVTSLPKEVYFVSGNHPSSGRPVMALRYSEHAANFYAQAYPHCGMRKFKARVIWEEVTD